MRPTRRAEDEEGSIGLHGAIQEHTARAPGSDTRAPGIRGRAGLGGLKRPREGPCTE